MVFALSILLVSPIFLSGIPVGNDLPQHYQFGLAYRDGISNGTLTLGWSPLVNEGFGDVGVRFYPPLAYWVLAAAHLFSGNWYDASVITFAFWFFISGVGVYFWAREWFSENAALLGAVVYMIAPYHANQLYNAFTYAEFAAAAVLPFCFLFATRLTTKGQWRDCVGLAISYAILLLVHIPMAVLGSVGIGVYLLVSLGREWSTLRACQSTLGIALGLAASSFYWLHVAIELPLVKHSTPEYSSEMYDFHINFLAGLFYISARDYDSRSLWFADIVLVLTLAIFLPGLAIILSQARSSFSRLAGVAFLGGFGLFISTPLSLPLWEHLRLLQMIQFPWRALVLISLTAAIFVAAAFDPIKRSLTTKMRPVGILAIGLMVTSAIFTVTQIIRPAILQDKETFLKGISTLSTAKSYECWWPVWANKTALADQRLRLTPDHGAVTTTMSGSGNVSFLLDSGPESVMRIPIFYYPHWVARVNDHRVDVSPADDGSILVPIPEGPASVELSFQEPYYVMVANIVSGITWVLLFLFLIFSNRVTSLQTHVSYE